MVEGLSSICKNVCLIPMHTHTHTHTHKVIKEKIKKQWKRREKYLVFLS
jgi:hypothetical protein